MFFLVLLVLLVRRVTSTGTPFIELQGRLGWIRLYRGSSREQLANVDLTVYAHARGTQATKLLFKASSTSKRILRITRGGPRIWDLGIQNCKQWKKNFNSPTYILIAHDLALTT